MQEFKVNYYLNRIKKNSKDYYFILVSVAWNKNRYRTTLKMHVDPNLWDNKKQRAKSSSKNPRIINDTLDGIRNLLREFHEEKLREFKRPPTLDEVKLLLLRVINNTTEIPAPPTKVINKTFLGHFQDFIKDSESGIRLSTKGKKIGKSTITSYKVTKNHLADFLGRRKSSISFDEVDEKFYSSLIKHLCEKNLSNNTQGKLIKIIKSFMHYTLEKGIHSNSKFIKTLKKFKEETVKVVLTLTELEQVENLENVPPELQAIKDIFLIQIYTGLRNSDLNNLKKENINLRERRITIYTIKTQDATVIPISKKLYHILEKYNRDIPKMSSQWYNRGLKKLCKLAGIDTRVQLTHYIGNVRKDMIKPKYELVSSHTARRTFITLSLKKGVLPEMVMKVSGHKDRLSFQSYVRISQEEAVDTLRDAWDS